MRKILCVLLILLSLQSIVLAEETHEAIIIEYNLYINHVKVDVKASEYPALNYQGVTYLPLTYDILSAFGLQMNFYFDKGFEIKPLDYQKAFEQKFNEGNQTLGRPVQPTIYNNQAVLNGVTYDDPSYPILFYNNILYIPMTWTVTQEIFDIPLTWKTGDGLYLGMDENVVMREAGMISGKDYTFKFKAPHNNPVGDEWSAIVFHNDKQLVGLETPLVAINDEVIFDIRIIEEDLYQSDYGYGEIRVPRGVLKSQLMGSYTTEIIVYEDNDEKSGKSTTVKFYLDLFKNSN